MKAAVPLFDQPHSSLPSSSSSPSSYSPLPWSDYFDGQQDVRVGDSTFRVYSAGRQDDSPFVVLLLHGGGQSSLSWACVASRIKAHVSVLAMDLRGHGSSATQDDLDLSASTGVSDIGCVLRALYAPAPPPPVLVAGHSLGGALAIRLTASALLPIIGCLCLDLVEGSAIASMEHIRQAVATRPSHFPSLPSAIEWTLRSSITSNAESARVSVPSQLRPAPDVANSTSYVWRTDLVSSQGHWLGWFTGLSSMFLSCSCPKLLLLASVDRLDREMSVGQMQGKLQVEVVRDAGHQLHEDQPGEVARLMLDWMQRQQMGRRAKMMRQGGGTGVVLITPTPR